MSKGMSLKVLAVAMLLFFGGMVFASTPAQADAQAIYNKKCKKCHGATGKADTKMGKKYNIVDFTSADFQKKTSDEKMIKIIKEGYKDPKNPKRKMRAYGKKLSDDEIKGLVKLIRSFGK